MFITVGLGNFGKKYQNNRHNVGFKLIDFPKKENIPVKFLKTNCFMNQSGGFVKKIVQQHHLNINNLIIAHDDLDIPLGKFKIQKGKGPKLHYGLLSIERALSTKDFWRIRIGVDNRLSENRIDGETYVLQDFSPEEVNILENQVFPEILERIKDFFVIR